MLKYQPRTAGTIVNAACVVYNILRKNNISNVDGVDDVAPSDSDLDSQVPVVAAPISGTQAEYFAFGSAHRDQIASWITQ